MTKTIKELYNSIRVLESEIIFALNDEGGNVTRIDVDDFNFHTGDSRTVDNNLLIQMYDAVMYLIHIRRLDTRTKPYTVDKFYGFSTGFWNTTGAQQVEANDFKKDGYKTIYSHKTLDGSYFIDETNNFSQRHTFGVLYYQNKIFYNGDYTDRFYPIYQGGDAIDYADLTEFNEGFFDPSIIKIETQTQLNLWLDGLESIITRIQDMSNYRLNWEALDYNYLGDYYTSHHVSIIVSYSAYQDEIVSMWVQSSEFSDFTIYSDDDGGTLPTSKTIDGQTISFEDSIKEVYDSARLIAITNGKSGVSGNTWYKYNNTEIDYEVDNPDTGDPIGTFVGGTYNKNIDANYYLNIDNTYAYGYFQKLIPLYTVNTYQAEGALTPEFEREASILESVQIDYSDVLIHREKSDDNPEGELINVPTATTDGEDFYITPDKFKTFVGLDYSMFTIEALSAPEEPE